MPTRPDVRDLTTNVREAFADADRDTLLEVLTFVVRTYVVDGPPPALVHQVERLEELASLSFAELIGALQARLPQPELGLFAVEQGRVLLRTGNGNVPVSADLAPARPDVIPPSPARAPATLSVAASPTQPRATPSVSRGSGGESPAVLPAAVAPAAAAAGANSALVPSTGSSERPPTPVAKPAEPQGGEGGEDGAKRFSLLELD